MQDKAIRTFGKLSIGLIVGMVAACAGGDTPPTTTKLEQDIAAAYPPSGSATGVAGSGSTPSGGTGGSAPRPPSNGGSSSGRGGSGAGGSASPGTGGSASTGEAGSSAAGTAGMTPVGSGACDGFAILKSSCGSAGCHGAGSSVGNFAESLDDAKSFVDEEGPGSCNGRGPLFDPANAAASIVVQKIEGTINCGSRMPLTGDYLDPAEVDCVKEWIGDL